MHRVNSVLVSRPRRALLPRGSGVDGAQAVTKIVTPSGPRDARRRTLPFCLAGGCDSDSLTWLAGRVANGYSHRMFCSG